MTDLDESNQRIGNRLGMAAAEVSRWRGILEDAIESRVVREIILDKIDDLKTALEQKLRRCEADTLHKVQGGLDALDSAIIQIKEKL